MTLARHVPSALAIIFGALSAVLAHGCAPPAAPWWKVALFAAACAGLVGWIAILFYRWVLGDDPSPITRRDISCMCGKRVLRSAVTLDDSDADRNRAALTFECDHCFDLLKDVPLRGRPVIPQLLSKAVSAVDRAERIAGVNPPCDPTTRPDPTPAPPMPPEPRASARATVTYGESFPAVVFGEPNL